MSRNQIQFGRPSKKKVTPTELELLIENLSLEGAGVAKYEGKTVFVEQAVPGDKVKAKIIKHHKNYDQAVIVNILEPSEHRKTASCEHYEQCGGCQLQHLENSAQLLFKEKAVISLLEKNAKITPTEISKPLTSSPQHYRRSARIGINQLHSTDSTIVGFRRKKSSKLLQVSTCEVLPAHLKDLFNQLRLTIDQIDNAKHITHIEYLQGHNEGALTFRCKSTLSQLSIQLLKEMLAPFKLQGFLRYDESFVPLSENKDPLYYESHHLKLHFKPGDFLQVNANVNQEMIARAMEWLDLNDKDQVLDLFSGLGNFSLPIAKQVNQLIGVEGSDDMVKRASTNASINNIDNCTFYKADLSQSIHHKEWFKQTFNKLILDPPRSGATEVIKNVFSDNQQSHIQYILYVACDASSLARDAKLLTELGYEMAKFCVMDMFPNTAHIESMALFVRSANRKGKKAKSYQTTQLNNSKKKRLFR